MQNHLTIWFKITYEILKSWISTALKKTFVILIYIPILFYRYDALTGVPSIQRTVAFEKASVLFNLAALHTQIGARQDRTVNSDTADAAVDNFLRAAGTLRYIGEHFTHPPSFDLAPHTLEALTALFLVSNLHILDTVINLVIECRSSHYLVETEISIITYKNIHLD